MMPSIIETIKTVSEFAKKGMTIELQETIMQLREQALELQEENLKLKKANSELKEAAELKEKLETENTKLKKENQELKSKLKELTKKGELSENEIKILVFLSSHENATDEEIAGSLSVSLTKTKYYLERMWNKYVYSNDYYTDQPSEYYLIQEGREYLVENGLVE